jgi:hypothetical protein
VTVNALLLTDVNKATLLCSCSLSWISPFIVWSAALTHLQRASSRMDHGPLASPLLALRDQGAQTLSSPQIAVIISLERAGATLSMVGVVLIFITFATFKRIRTVPNLFILFASVANVGASIACIMGYDGITAGLDSSLCQAQAFLLEL